LLPALFGEHDRHLARIEQLLGVSITSRGNCVAISGPPGQAGVAKDALLTLHKRVRKGKSVDMGEVDAAVRMVDQPGGSANDEHGAAIGEDLSVRTRRRTVEARSPTQVTYLQALRDNELVFGVGPAGTGKTYLAVAVAVSMLLAGRVHRIILSRPAVEAGERLGFLPGDLREKVDPYLRPIYDALYDLMDSRIVERALQTGEIEIAPLAFMRGRTLTNAAIILDEAQNTTSMQMKMFLTRLGENSRMIITGDPSQVDLPNGQTSGLAEAARLLDGVEGIAQVKFTAEDVIRHELVARIVAAYEGLPQRPAASRP